MSELIFLGMARGSETRAGWGDMGQRCPPIWVQPGDSCLQEVPGGHGTTQLAGCADGWEHPLWDGTTSSVSFSAIDYIINRVKKHDYFKSRSEVIPWHM